MNAKSVGGGGRSEDYIYIREEQPTTTEGGTFTFGSYVTRILNTEVHDTGNNAALSSNQITLQPGTYRFLAFAPALAINTHWLRLRNISDSVTIEIGEAEFAAVAFAVGNKAFIRGRFTIDAVKIIELQHQCTATRITNGLGLANPVEISIFASIEMWKEN